MMMMIPGDNDDHARQDNHDRMTMDGYRNDNHHHHHHHHHQHYEHTPPTIPASNCSRSRNGGAAGRGMRRRAGKTGQ